MNTAPIELKSLEVCIHPQQISQQEWNVLFNTMKNYIEHATDEHIAAYSEMAVIDKDVTVDCIHISVRRAFTTDIITLHADLSWYIDQDRPVVCLGVANEYGRISTPLIMDVAVLLSAQLPDAVTIDGYLHPRDWTKALERLQKRGSFM
ncbi:hypothetical protein [Bacillus piscicola]|uniref:hypothetical protein n=1 Tax=Bacillus piscicola TaxID=1632684 RepID=UPI001F089247|nr:hypothetical protein [Bacillus piscicola]